MKEAFFKSLIERKSLYCILSLLVLSGLTFMLKDLKSEYDYRIWFRTSEPLIKHYDSFQDKYGNDDVVVVFVKSPNGIFTNESLQITRELTDELWQTSDIISVDSLVNYPFVEVEEDDIVINEFIEDGELTNKELLRKKKKALSHRVMPDYLISSDGNVTGLYAKLRPFYNEAVDSKKIIDQVKNVITVFKKKYPRYSFYINGSIAVNDAFREVSEQDMATLMPLISLIIILFLYFIFKSIWGVILPLIVVLCTSLSTCGAMALLGIRINNMTGVVPIILIGVCIADAVHLLSSIKIKMQEGQSKLESVRFSLQKNFMPTVLTTVSTVIGFSSLSSSELVPLAKMGVSAAIGTIFAWIYTFCLMIPLCLMVNFKADQVKENASNFWQRCTQTIITFINQYKKAIVSSFVILFALCIHLGLKNRVNSNPYNFFASDVPIKVSNDFIIDNIGGFYGPQIDIKSGVKEGVKNPQFLINVQNFVNWLESDKKITRVNSILDAIKSTNQALHEDKKEYYSIPKTQKQVSEALFVYMLGLPQEKSLGDQITLNNESMRLSVNWTYQESSEALAKIDEIKKKAQEQGLDILVTGKSPIYLSMNGFVVSTFFKSMMIALILIALLVLIIFKSPLLALLSLLPNILPLGLGGAVLYLLGKDIDLGTAIVNSVCLGIVIDDTIHFLFSYKTYEAEGLGPIERIQKIYSHTGKSLTWTTLVVMASFGVMVFGSFVPNINFGILTALTLGFALIVDLVFLPSVLLMTGPKNK